MNFSSSNLIPRFVKLLIMVYVINIIILGALRFVLFVSAYGIDNIQYTPLVKRSFLIGVQFDSVVLSYILALPLLLLFIKAILKSQSEFIPRFIAYYFAVIFSVLIFITIADIPYFLFFTNRLSEASFQWFGDFKTVWGMLVRSSAYLTMLVVASVVSIAVGVFFKRFTQRHLIDYNWEDEYENTGRVKYTSLFLLMGGATFMGLRGTIAHPIRQADAFHCEDPILNQLGLNPAFTVLKSLTSKVALMDDKLAIAKTQELLNILQPIEKISPIAHEVKSNDAMLKANVVIVLMESMSANYMGTFGNRNHLTPTLDSLAENSWFFKNAYSAGIHTNNGVFSTLYSFPALKRERPMSTSPTRIYSGLPYVLKQHGYTNLFFSTHNKYFDNLANFIPNNHFDKLYTSELYPADKLIGPFGIPDDYLFSYAVDKINKLDKQTPFFATILTTSNHDPYILPEYFKSNQQDKSYRAVSYADWSINQFLTQAKKQPWFNNTVFVFVSDHGLNVGENPYEIALSYNHIPIIIHAPWLLKEPIVFETFMGQIDIFPTLMGIFNISYINNTLGRDVLKEPRENIYFSADDKLACINKEYLFVYNYSGREFLYKLGNTKNIAEDQKDITDELKNTAFAQTQVSQWIYSNDKAEISFK